MLLYISGSFGFPLFIRLAVAVFLAIGPQGPKVASKRVSGSWSDLQPRKPSVDLACRDRADTGLFKILRKPSKAQPQILAIALTAPVFCPRRNKTLHCISDTDGLLVRSQ